MHQIAGIIAEIASFPPTYTLAAINIKSALIAANTLILSKISTLIAHFMRNIATNQAILGTS